MPITWADKVDGASGATGKVVAADMNEIKTAITALEGSGISFTTISTVWDWSSENAAVPTLTGSTAITTTGSPAVGKCIKFVQDGTGSRAVTLNGDSLPVATAANSVTIFSLIQDENGDFGMIKDTSFFAITVPIPDTTAPTISTVEATDANTIVVTLDEAVTGTTAGWSFSNGSALTVTGVSGSGTDTLTFTVSDTLTSSDTLTFAYNSGTGDTEDLSANALASDSGSVTNSISSYDTESSAYFTAETISSSTEQDAVDINLVKGLKSDSLFSHCVIQYPFLGTGHDRNLMSPGNTDGDFRISYSGTWTHNSAGSTGNGSNGVGNSHFIPSAHLTSSASSVVIAVGGTAPASECIFGAYDGTGKSTRFLRSNAAGGLITAEIDGSSGANFSDAAGAAVYVMTRNGTSISLYKNGTLINTLTNAAAGLCTANLYVGAQNNVFAGVTNEYSASTIKYIGVLDKSLNGTEVTAITGRVQSFLTALSR